VQLGKDQSPETSSCSVDENDDEATKWLLDMDLSEPVEQLFTVTDDAAFDDSLTELEAEMAVCSSSSSGSGSGFASVSGPGPAFTSTRCFSPISSMSESERISAPSSRLTSVTEQVSCWLCE